MSMRRIDAPLQLRAARHTGRLDEVVAFYRDGIGLQEAGRFRNHDGYDGVFLTIPGTDAHLEFTSGGTHEPPAPHPESLLVFYVGDDRTLREMVERLQAPAVPPANPYWAEHGFTVEDPDGFRVVLVPERWAAQPACAAIRVEAYNGPRARLRPLFEFAEDSARALDGYIHAGRILVALAGREIVGHIQITATGSSHEAEIKSIAVDPALRRQGVGRALVEAAVELARAENRSTLVVGAATADVGNLRFYQRLAFRMRSVERDAFTPARGYGPGLSVDGMEVLDRVWLTRALD
jgi:ribosomal protein S18 acetylase RimI-like enzyme